jgi:TonB family protein
MPQPQAAKNIVVAPSETKITKNTPVPKKSTSFKKTAKVSNKGPRGGGYKGEGPRGYGTNEPYMNSIGALGALNSPRVKGGNGGRGGLNLQAVGTEAGSGAGGKGYGGFGNNGAGGRGKGGLGIGKGMGFSNAMYGKGLIAAPFGDGGAAPGSGGYGTRGKAGGGAQGAGYGTETIVGSWKGTGPKGNGPAGSGVGNGDPYGSPWGNVDGDDGDAIVTGGLDRDQINEVIMRNLGQIRYCYEQGLQRKPDLSGRVSVKFQIGGGGSVTTANVKHSSVRSAQVESCIVAKLRNWRFPKPHGGVSVAVTYPFVLRRNVSMR